jgi:branched-subunit amino acid transport protein
MNAWTVVLAAGLGSYLLRMSMIGAADRIRLPARLDDSAELVAPSAFAALAITSIAGSAVAAGIPQAFAPVLAAVVAALAVMKTGSTDAAGLAGMPTLWIMTALTAA